MAKKIDPNDLVDTAEAADIMNLENQRGVSVYRTRWPDFPKPVIEKGRCILWLRADVEAWRAKHPGRDR